MCLAEDEGICSMVLGMCKQLWSYVFLWVVQMPRRATRLWRLWRTHCEYSYWHVFR